MNCNQCRETFEQLAFQFVLNGITFQFCSEACMAAFKAKRKVE